MRLERKKTNKRRKEVEVDFTLHTNLAGKRTQAKVFNRWVTPQVARGTLDV